MNKKNNRISWSILIETKLKGFPVMISHGGAIGLYLVEDYCEVGKNSFITVLMLDPENRKIVGAKWINCDCIDSFSKVEPYDEQ